jgi:endonuclease YncB( thermonuclease family)
MKTLFAAALLYCSLAAAAGEWSGQVVGVTDGDTLAVMQAGRVMKVRLVEIDAPEAKQDFGQRSKQSLSELCFDQTATVHDQGHDRYGRVLGRVFCDGTDANAEQIRRGMAWWYVRYGKDLALRRMEAEARADRRGLWAAPDPMPPWGFRRSKR